MGHLAVELKPNLTWDEGEYIGLANYKPITTIIIDTLLSNLNLFELIQFIRNGKKVEVSLADLNNLFKKHSRKNLFMLIYSYYILEKNP